MYKCYFNSKNELTNRIQENAVTKFQLEESDRCSSKFTEHFLSFNSSNSQQCLHFTEEETEVTERKGNFVYSSPAVWEGKPGF